MISLISPGGRAIHRSSRTLRPELLETADETLADRNLLDIARINRWFGGHRALVRVLKGLAPRGKPFSVLDVGAGSGDMGNCIRRRFQNATVVSLDHRRFHLRRAHFRSCRTRSISCFALPFCMILEIMKSSN
jgi:ubiquinone/menaquinone biosynthesis C-methylase UbiE